MGYAGAALDHPRRDDMAFKWIVAAGAALAATAAPAAYDPAMAPSASDSASTRYCMKVEPVTGSRVETVECWTRAEWTEQGVDLDKDWAREGVSIIA
jgi:hypothetical protein